MGRRKLTRADKIRRELKAARFTSTCLKNGLRKGVNKMEEKWITAREQLDYMPYDKMFNGEFCHATGDIVRDENGEWWNEYESPDGEMHYGH